MLGEPGSGKSYELSKLRNRLNSLNGNDNIHYCDLRSVGNESHFEERVFNNTIVQPWIEGDYNLFILLDSFDESYLRSGVIATLLADRLEEFPLERLFLYIACRTGYWPNSLTTQLSDIFSDGVKILNLAVLRKNDILHAANQDLQDHPSRNATDFIQKVENLHGISFAVRPITLKALIEQYKRTNNIRANRRELYKSYCNYLCSESNLRRRDARLDIRYTPEQKYLASSRFAALSIFSNKPYFWSGDEVNDIPDNAIPLSILRQGQENISGQNFGITEQCVIETLASGLFITIDNMCEWAHWSFMEFLASEYINQKEIPLEQMLNLILNPFDHKVIPALRGLVAWLCTSKEEIFDLILAQEPEILIQSDLAIFPDNTKESIVQNIFDQYEGSSLEIRLFDLANYYHNLNHPNLTNQIRTALQNPEYIHGVKLLAIKIAEKCNLFSLTSFLIELALDEDINYQIRNFACYTLEVFSSEMHLQGSSIEEIEQLIPLALTDDLGEDRYDLKGYCLNILYPEHVTFNQFIEHFPEPIQGYGGDYFRFLVQNFVTKLPEHNIGDALIWIRENLANFDQFSIKYDISEEILEKSLNYISNSELITELGLTISYLITNNYLLREIHHRTTFRDQINQNQELRRNLITKVVHNIPNEERFLIHLISNVLLQENGIFNIQRNQRLIDLIHIDDLDFLVQEVQSSDDHEYKEKLAWIINRIFPRDHSQDDLAFKLYRTEDVFRQYFIFWFGPIELGSEEEERMREEFRREEEIQQAIERSGSLRESTQHQAIAPDITDRIENCLNRFEQGELDMWWRLNILLAVNENGYYVSFYDYYPNITQYPGWINSSEEIQQRIITASKRYILEADPHTDDWLREDTIHRPAYAGYRAIRLNYEYDNSFLHNLSADIWRKWVASVLYFKFIQNTAINIEVEKNIQVELLELSYTHAGEEFNHALKNFIESQARDPLDLALLDRIGPIFNDQIALIIQNIILESPIEIQIKGQLINFLLSYDYQPTIDYVLQLLSNPNLEDEHHEQETILATKALISHLPNEHWNVSFSLLQDHTELGRRIISELADINHFSNAVLNLINEQNLSDLYIWVFTHFPEDEDIPLTGMARFLTNRDFITSFRDEIINTLERRGNFDAVSALQRISMEIPAIRNNISYRIIRAQEIARLNTWEPPKPQEIYMLFHNTSARIILSGKQFIEVIIESLHRLEDKLQGREGYHPIAINYWHHQGDRRFCPFYEEDFSDNIKNHLMADLTREIVINREVVIDPTSRPDIKIDLINPDALFQANRSITVIIEAKGSWHNELNTAMESQLFRQYLLPRGYYYGLYLVGWFTSQYCDPDCTRCSDTPGGYHSIEELSDYLINQAEELSQGGITILPCIIDCSLNEIRTGNYR